MLFKLLIFSFCLKIVLSYSNGAGSEACEDLQPQHGPFGPTEGESPVEVLFESDVVTAGQLIELHLNSRDPGFLYRGFMIQARVVDPESNVPGRVVGTFELTAGVQYVQCPTLPPNSVVTQTTNTDRNSIQLLWRAPPNIVGDYITVNFYKTIVENFVNFWVYDISSPITVINPLRSRQR